MRRECEQHLTRPATPPPAAARQPALTLQTVASGLSNPLYLTAPAGDARLFVVEQGGRKIPALQGAYFFADYCKGWVRSLRYDAGQVSDVPSWPFGQTGNVLSFGEDSAGELYVLSANGNVYRIVSGE